jgi:hypothetical protein
MHPRYNEWLEYVFDHLVTDPAWYWDTNSRGWDMDTADTVSDDDWDAYYAQYQVEIVELLALTFQRAGTDLRQFTDAQVNQGLWYLTSIGSEYLHFITDRQHEYEIPLFYRLTVIEAIYDLYAYCFRTRCTETLSHLNEPASELNGICYMFWDTNCSLSSLESVRDKEQFEEAVFRVLGRILTIPHRACREGALHGLGHLQIEYPERVAALVDTFLQHAELDDALRQYALRARGGRVQ